MGERRDDDVAVRLRHHAFRTIDRIAHGIYRRPVGILLPAVLTIALRGPQQVVRRDSEREVRGTYGAGVRRLRGSSFERGQRNAEGIFIAGARHEEGLPFGAEGCRHGGQIAGVVRLLVVGHRSTSREVVFLVRLVGKPVLVGMEIGVGGRGKRDSIGQDHPSALVYGQCYRLRAGLPLTQTDACGLVEQLLRQLVGWGLADA